TPSSVRGLWMPGVSTITSCPSGRFRMPRMARLVVCGLSLVMAIFSPTSALVSVDLPTFGRPTNVTNPLRVSVIPVLSIHVVILLRHPLHEHRGDASPPPARRAAGEHESIHGCRGAG